MPVLLAAVLLLGGPALRCRAAGDRPNILWLVSEDNSRYLGCYGDALARTPTLDRLARRGVQYERCFGGPVCAPARFALISGMSPTTCGPAHHMRAQGRIPRWLRGFPALLRDAGYFTSNNAKTDYNAPVKVREAWSESGRAGHWRNRAPGQPFFSVFNHEVTHESCLFPERDVPLGFPPTDPARVRVPSYLPDTPAIRSDLARYYDHMRMMDAQVAARLRELEEDGLADDTLVFYYSDNGGVLPRGKRCLQQSGIHVPLIVYFPPKWRHLAPAPPGSRVRHPVSFVDFAPTVLSLAGVPRPGYLEGQPFAGPARGTPRKLAFVSRDRMDERYDMSRAVASERWLYIRNFRPDLPYVQPLRYMFQARGYQSWAREAAAGRLTPETARFWGRKPAEELYDLDADPDNVRNLAASPAHRKTVRRMRAALKRQVLGSRDNGFLPEGSPLEGYEASRAPGAWPVERVFDLAVLASERDPAHLPRLLRALDDESEPVRWWAAQGCAMLGGDASAAGAALRARLEDPSGAVAAAAAEALARMGQEEAALPALERLIGAGAAPDTVRHAANVLDRLGERARPALPAMRRALAAAPAAEGGTYPPQQVLFHAVDVLEGRAAALVYPTPPAGSTTSP